jgi:hypothetical protein
MSMIKSLRFTIVAMAAAVLVLASCSTHKKSALPKNAPIASDTIGQAEFLKNVHKSSEITSRYVTAKLKFVVEMGPQKINLTGNLRMLRDDVIRLQLMYFGFVEAGRFEFTKDEVLIIDRINKQYLRAPYRYIDFLRNSGINFNTLQALFWNELFIPGTDNVNEKDLGKFSTDMGGDEAVIFLEKGRINYSWLANQKTGRIKMTNIMYRDSDHGNSQLNWNYLSYGSLNGKPFPNDMIVTLTTPKKEVKISIKFNYMGTDDQWETRSTVSGKYHEVTIDDLLKRIMSSF